MDYSKPTLLVISGPNGAGKSTHIQTMLPEDLAEIWSIDRDHTRTQFELHLTAQGVKNQLITKQATDMMEKVLIQQMKSSIQVKSHFVLETPLSHPDYWRYIDLFEDSGYQIQLNYLCLDKVGDCIARVDQRVLEGGHYVQPSTIKGVFTKNLEHINTYHKTFHAIELYDGMKIPTLLGRFEGDEVKTASSLALKKQWIKKGMPNLSKKIELYLKGK